MNIAVTNVPIWVSVLFFVSFSTIPVFLIANAAKEVLIRIGENPLKIKKQIIVFYWSYFIVVGVIALSGFFSVNVIPPRIIVYTAIPLLLFYLFIIPKKHWFQQIRKHITLEELIYIHVFRFVGVFFFVNYYYHALPKDFAFIGGAGDILIALFAVPVIYFLKRKKSYAKTLAFIWNCIGLLDILSVITSAIIITKKSIENNEIGVADFGTFPFCWIPAFAPATIIFLHLLIFRKL